MHSRVLHIISGDLWGGAETQVLAQLRALQQSEYDLHILCFSEGETFRRYNDARLNCKVVDESSGFFSWLRNCVAHAENVQPQIVVSHGYKEAVAGWWISKRRGVPHITWFHGANEVHAGWRQLRLSIYRFLHRTIARFSADAVVVVSESLAKQLQLKNPAIIRNVVPTSPGERNPTLLAHRPAAVIVGRLAEVKRVDLAIRAVERVNKRHHAVLHLYVIGTGELADALASLAKERNVEKQVHFLGFRNDAAAFIANADLLLLTSENEGIPTVILEAIASGTPIVSRALDGVSEVLSLAENFPAKLVNSRNPEDFAMALLQLLQQKSPPEERGSWKKTVDLHFSPTAAAKLHQKIYERVLSNSTPASS